MMGCDLGKAVTVFTTRSITLSGRLDIVVGFLSSMTDPLIAKHESTG